MPSKVELSRRLQKLFDKTKLVCFGRYALEVPLETEVTWGQVSIPSRVEIYSGGIGRERELGDSEIARIRDKEKTAELTYSGPGPIEQSWQLRYYDNEFMKKEGIQFITTFIRIEDKVFELGGDILNSAKPESEISEHNALALGLRLRKFDEVPDEPGYCIKHAFIREEKYATQEMVSFGIRLPSLPDVSFSVSSNKSAYASYAPSEFEKKREGLSLLHRISSAKKRLGPYYPSRTLLREGKRKVQHWMGEESLIRRSDGAHDFEWAFVGTPKDIANPSEFNVKLYTKVEHNLVGAAIGASISDDEAVALWDRLLSGLKFRVKVPGAPEGSYYLPSATSKGKPSNGAIK